MGCHDRRVQSLHSPLAGVLQYGSPHLRHDARTCTELKHNQIHCMISTHACQNACHFTCTWHMTLLAVQPLAVTGLQMYQQHTETAGHASLCSTATILTAYRFLYFPHTCACKVSRHKPAEVSDAYTPSTRANALSRGRVLASAGM